MPVNVTRDIWFIKSSGGVHCYCGRLVYETVWFGKWITLCYSATCYHTGEAPAKATLLLNNITLWKWHTVCCSESNILQTNVSFSPLKNLTQLADGPTLYVDWQGQGVCFASSANPLSLSQYKRLALNLLLKNFTCQNKLRTYSIIPVARRYDRYYWVLDSPHMSLLEHARFKAGVYKFLANTYIHTYIHTYICHGVGPLVDPFRSHVSRSLFKGLPRFLLPVEE